jgi:hypothetical protein
LLQSDEQVANRFEPVFLPRWKLGSEFTRLLASIEKAIGLKKASNLAHPDIGQRILDESDGVIGYMMNLLLMLAEASIRNGSECITLDDLSPKNLKRIGWVHPTRRHQFPI